MCTPCCKEPIKIRLENDNDCKCNCSSNCFSFLRRKSFEPLTAEQAIALQAIAQKNHQDDQIILEPKRVKKKIKVKKPLDR